MQTVLNVFSHVCGVVVDIVSAYSYVMFCCRVVENGVETVTVEENGIMKSMTINGEPQSIAVKS